MPSATPPGVADADGNQTVGLLGAHHHDGVRAAQLQASEARRLSQIVTLSCKLRH